MSDKPLPRPVTAVELYLAAILEELQAQRAMEIAIAPGDLVDLREPAPTGTPLPEDFPGRAALAAAGIDSLEAVPRDGDDLVAIAGIGKVTAGQILVRLM